MKRISTDKQFLESGTVVIDADGVQVEVASPAPTFTDVTALAVPAVKSGRILLSKDGHRRTLVFDQLRFVDAGSGTILVLPDVYDNRPAFTFAAPVYGLTTRAQVTVSGNVQGYNWAADGLIAGSLSWTTATVEGA